MPLSIIPDWLRAAGATLGLIVLSVLAGRLAWHADQVKQGRRRLWSRELFLEVPTVAAMAGVAWALADYFGMSPGMASGAGAVLGWYGPKGMERVVFLVWRSRTASIPSAPGGEPGRDDA